MGILRTTDPSAGITRPRAAWAGALLVLLAATGCAPEVQSVPAESVAASEAAAAEQAGDAATPDGQSSERPTRKQDRAKAGESARGTGGGAAGAAGQAGSRQVTAGPITFAAPSGWQGFDEQRLAEGMGRSWLRRIAQRMGLTDEQMMASVAATDLMLVDPAAAAQGFADNLNVVTVPGSVPGDEQLRQQFLAVGAVVHGIEHSRTGVGDSVSLAYDLAVGDWAIAGEVVMVEVGGRTTTVTVSALDRDVTRKVAGLARDTLAAAR